MSKNDNGHISEWLNEEFAYRETDLRMFMSNHYKLEMGFALLCVSGEALLTIGVLENRIIPDTELIVLPKSTISLVSASEDFRVRMFVFSSELMDNTSLRLGSSLFLFLRDTPFSQHTPNCTLLRNLNVLMDNAELVSGEKTNEMVELMRFNFLQNYFIYLYDKCQNHFSHLFKTYSHKRSLFFQFLSILDEHYEKERNVAFYADQLAITPRYLRKITAENANFKSPKEMIDKRLIIEIETLLYKTDYSLQEIAEQLNFPDQSYLSRYFKSHKGCSPLHYRKAIKFLN